MPTDVDACFNMHTDVDACFNMHTDVDACDCIQELYRRHMRVYTGSGFGEKNRLPHCGLKPTSVLHLAFHLAIPAQVLPSTTSTISNKGLKCCPFLCVYRLVFRLIYFM